MKTSGTTVQTSISVVYQH